jgi:GNAT superfamily N-acetyltransferase
MDIIPYVELRDKHQMVPVSLLAGFGLREPRDIERQMQHDFRLMGGLYCLCAVQGDELLGFVVIMRIPTRTLDGSERMVGGIGGITTNPRHLQEGVGVALLDAAHEFFRAERMHFSFLQTSRSWGAYALYRRLGYLEVDAINSAPSVYCLMEPVSNTAKNQGKTTAPTEEGVARLFSEFTADFTGFVIRPKDFLGFMLRHNRVNAEVSFQGERGYLLATESLRTVQIEEIVVKDAGSQMELLEALELKAPKVIFDPLVTSPGLLRGYITRGYHVQMGRHFVWMAKALEADIAMKDVYGEDLYISPLEFF